MTLRKKGKYSYGDDLADLQAEVIQYAANGYPARVFLTLSCPCRTRAPDAEESLFLVRYSEHEGAATAECQHCEGVYPIADSAEYDVQLNCMTGCYCKLDEEYGQVVVGAALHEGSEDLRWLYIGWRATRCGLVGVYADWKYDGSTSWPEVVSAWQRVTSAAAKG